MHPRTRVNPFEIALWILGVVLLVGGVAGALWGSRVMSQGFSCSGADCSAPTDYALAQAFYMLAPPLVTAGLVAVVLLIALRAALGIARRAAAPEAPVVEPEDLREGGASAEQAAAQLTVPRRLTEAENPTARVDPDSFAPPQFRQRRRAVDHSAFKRPTAD